MEVHNIYLTHPISEMYRFQISENYEQELVTHFIELGENQNRWI